MFDDKPSKSSIRIVWDECSGAVVVGEEWRPANDIADVEMRIRTLNASHGEEKYRIEYSDSTAETLCGAFRQLNDLSRKIAHRAWKVGEQAAAAYKGDKAAMLKAGK